MALKRSIINPGSIALWAGLITALIGPLQAALFAPGGALRFVGSAIESLAAALPSVATVITAASLIAPPNPIPVSDNSDDSSDNGDKKKRRWASYWPLSWLKQDDDVNAVYDPNFAEINVAEEKPQQRRQRPSLARMRQESVRLGSQVKRQSLLAMKARHLRCTFGSTLLVSSLPRPSFAASLLD